MKSSNQLIVFLLCLIVALVIMQISTCNESRDKDGIIQAQYDVMKSERDAEGRETVSRQVVEAGFDAMRKYYGDSIKKLIDKNTVSLTRAKTKTTNGGTTATTIRNARRDSTGNGRQENILLPTNEPSSTGTFREDSTGILEFPVYETVHTDKWQTYSIIAGPDSTTLEHISYNEYSIKTEFARQGKGFKAFFQPKVLQVSITNENPRTQTLGVDSWHIPVEKNNTGLKVSTGILIGVGVGYLLFH